MKKTITTLVTVLALAGFFTISTPQEAEAQEIVEYKIAGGISSSACLRRPRNSQHRIAFYNDLKPSRSHPS